MAASEDDLHAALEQRLDDPSFNPPIYANLFDDSDEGYSLLWSRPLKHLD